MGLATDESSTAKMPFAFIDNSAIEFIRDDDGEE